MSNSSYILSIDQGTSSTKTLIFDDLGKVISRASVPLKSYYSQDGWVEQHPEEIYLNVLQSVEKCLIDFHSLGGNLASIKACGISNQRETFVVWDEHGVPLYNAISWQCKRSIAICERLSHDGLEEIIKLKTGLIIDPYFSGSKLIWLHENNEKVRKVIDAGKAYFGTVDSWLLFKLTQGKSYFTDYTNASRTLFFNLHTLTWDSDLLSIFKLSDLHLPEPKPSAAIFGESTFNGLFQNPINITSMIGDSHAAAFGEGCITPGTAKATLGTGSSIMMNIGSGPKISGHGMITTICWSFKDRVDYALEGVIVSCGSTIEWLKNELGLFTESRDTEAIAKAIPNNGGVYIVPAFSGLGAPHWQMDRKASISGLTFGSTKGHIVRAALESVSYQIKDVIVAMEKDSGISLAELMVNGGMTSNLFVLQLLTDLLDKPVINKDIPDVSAKGAAFLAGLQAGIYKDLDHLTQLPTEKIITEPSGNTLVKAWYKNWQQVVSGN